MNEILQQRIEEAAKTSITETLMSTPNYEFSPKATDMLECAYIKGAEDILNNQWISVEEALPEEEFDDEYKFVFVIVKIDEETSYYDTDYIRNGTWELHNADNVTHWMEIPSLEGGEK